ncbi:MAG: aspartate-semialdehyde dehydrogenase [Bacteroidetes bacterium]|nr:aspartate-semialdehyde dehydrogenase [Bacteroidota bacterium]MBU1577801.1 aspartate-semialdehyde dehydrogenase [Bacteroidota bacterium]MBU2466787.1 aspartate-semialdehyde dehydrogenase [Bacteroidota bacterium]MBU2558761.1 aspartate-semialdehyde dehydrogenase [Bacteroidota bacterium]
MKIALIGATGLVGEKMLRVLEEQSIRATTLLAVASDRSLGKSIHYFDQELSIIQASEALEARPDIVLMSAGGNVSRKLAPLFVSQGSVVIDNSSAWRNDAAVPLVVPEVNAHTISRHKGIIANPNCSTIQLVTALACLHRAFGIKRLVIATYQSVSGSGIKGLQQLENEQNGFSTATPAYPHPIHKNVIPHGGDFNAEGDTAEEEKLLFETRKILEAPTIAITSTVVRVPVTGGHSMAVNIEFEKDFSLDAISQLLKQAPGIVLQDDPQQNIYPMPIDAADKDAVFVGRIRRDKSIASGLNMWIVADNLRKGAATNAVQIAKFLIENKLV